MTLSTTLSSPLASMQYKVNASVGIDCVIERTHNVLLRTLSQLGTSLKMSHVQKSLEVFCLHCCSMVYSGNQASLSYSSTLVVSQYSVMTSSSSTGVVRLYVNTIFWWVRITGLGDLPYWTLLRPNLTFYDLSKYHFS
jgi:hypothetical protein